MLCAPATAKRAGEDPQKNEDLSAQKTDILTDSRLTLEMF